MKAYAIVNEIKKSDDLACLIRYDKSDTFIIVLNKDCDGSELPLILESFFKKGTFIIDPAWSKRFVESRIIPAERQNLAAILKRYGLKEYSRTKLLELSKGRCAQDDCVLIPIAELPVWLLNQQKSLIREVLPLRDESLLLEFTDDRLFFVDLKPMIQTDRRLSFLKSHPERIEEVSLVPGGYGISLNGTVCIMIEELCDHLCDHRLTADDLRLYFDNALLATGEACDRLRCSRQYINSLIKRNRLQVFRKLENVQLFRRSDVEKLLW